MQYREITAQTVGAFLVFFATRICHWAFVNAIHTWWLSPKNRSMYFKDFAAAAAKGNVDMTLIMKHHPETISETFGDESTSEFQIVEATVRPAATVLLVGNMMMHLKGGGVFQCLLSALRGCIAPFGLMMVVSTPVISGGGGCNARMRLSLPTADLNLLYIFQWVFLHFVGFACFVGPSLLWELPAAVLDLFNPPQPEAGQTWPQIPRILWYCLTSLRMVCPILMLRAAPYLFTEEAKNPNTLRAKKWYGEYCVGEFGAAVMYFNALSVFFLPGQGPYSIMDKVVIGAMLLDSFRILLFYGLWSMWVLHAWDEIDWKYECMSRTTMSHGPVMKALRTLTDRQLVFLHAVQAGQFDPTEWHVTSSPLPTWIINGALGVAQGHVRQFVIRPENYTNFLAYDFMDLQKDDLELFSEDLLAVISALPSTATLFFPFGDIYKKTVRRPFLCLSCEDFEAEIERIGVKANTDLPSCRDDEVAFDITDKVLGMEGCPAAFQTRGFCEALAEDGSMILALFGQLLNPQGYKEVERPDLGPHYEVQVRLPQRFILRTLKEQKLPEGWEELRASLLPPELAGGSEPKKAR
ncbi:unnamed protein product [Effrenium voratum]|uniref:Uncharacterized protein n=1 Tax=Effrenium voratum TaxID=2562239 RepID=A0AA36JDJ4_9DINO|nr:unnamed protein product [Effrenium voratum]